MVTVVFDGACFSDGPITGVGRAFHNGITAYAGQFDSRCVLLVPEGVSVPPPAGVQVATAPRGVVRRQLALPSLLRQLRADVLHSSVVSVPLRAPCPTIATVHDLPWLHAELGEPTTAWRRFATRRALRAATRIVSPSTFTANDVARLLGEFSPPTCVLAHCTELGAAPATGSTSSRRGPLLVLGDDRARKNRDRVRAAHALAQRQCADVPALRFVGPPFDYVSEAAKVELLRTCRAVVQCSLFEGFGLPVLEALANGAPVLCSDIPPFREIAGDHAVFVEPRSIDAIAAGMVAIHMDNDLREALVAPGWRRAAACDGSHLATAWHKLHTEILR